MPSGCSPQPGAAPASLALLGCWLQRCACFYACHGTAWCFSSLTLVPQTAAGTWHETQVAVKVLIDKEAMAAAGPREALSLPAQLLAKLDDEASVLASLRHPNVVRWRRCPQRCPTTIAAGVCCTPLLPAVRL